MLQHSMLNVFNNSFSHLLVTVGYVSDLVPWEGALRCQFVFWLVDVQTQGIHSQQQVCSLFILNHIRGRKAFLLLDTSEQL